jgi:hypothetical protein
MFHVISAGLDRLARRINARLAIPFEYAAWHGWEVTRLSRGTWQFRDPRFGQLAAVRAASTLVPEDSRSWAQDAMAERIRALGSPDHPHRGTGRGA